MYITELSPIFYFISVHQEYEIHQGLSHFKIDYVLSLGFFSPLVHLF